MQSRSPEPAPEASTLEALRKFIGGDWVESESGESFEIYHLAGMR